MSLTSNGSSLSETNSLVFFNVMLIRNKTTRIFDYKNTQTPTLEHRYRTKKDRKKNKNFVKPDDPELDHSIYDESGKKLIERETMKFCKNFKKLLENNGVVYMIELDSIHNGIRHVLVRSSTLSLISNGTWS